MLRPSIQETCRALVWILAAGAPLEADCLLAFQRADANRDDKVDLSDPISTLGYLFLGAAEPGCLDAADADDNGKIDLSDAVFTVGYLFLGGAPIPPPVPKDCGIDPTDDPLTCLEYSPCAPPDRIPCTSNDCCDPDSYCAKEVDDCDGVGDCVVRPDACPAIFDPWCGCNGKTYGSRCEAAGAGVNVVHRGECGIVGLCLSSKECGAESYCEKPEGLCDDPGQCVPRPQGCPENFDPVCGCDGNTYGNQCDAASKGVSIAFRGECKRFVPCASNDECDAKEYCFKQEGQCDLQGFCSPRPDTCDLFIDPVCGCDGMTYDNYCFAIANGVSVSQFGPCQNTLPCSTDEECDAGSFCIRREGLCDLPGYCHVDLDLAECRGAPDQLVCGCDGTTYQNACLALAAGVSVQRRTGCEFGGRCASNEDCVEAAYCIKSEGFCDDSGVCVPDPRPEDCQGIPEFPVCGCDDNTYRSYCEANVAGVNVAYTGACDGVPRCNRNGECGDDSYCSYGEGPCGGLGKCLLRPLDCPDDFIDPVCGCDKVTYRNECLAAQAGVSIAFRGSCNGGGGDCSTSALCGGGLYCAKPDGDCDGLGHCDATPSNCSDVLDPVCGCDGITYGNECKAHASGVNVLQPGECPN